MPPYDQVPEYGIRIDFEIPVTTRCLQCQDTRKGGGTCGFDTETQGFLCLCDGRNVTSYCAGKLVLFCWRFYNLFIHLLWAFDVVLVSVSYLDVFCIWVDVEIEIRDGFG